MNEFAAKKLGEVLAFSVVGSEILEKGETAFKSVLEDYDSVKEKFSDQRVAIQELAESLNFSEITLPKSEKTREKLLRMAEMYIGDEWDNPAELLEWMGFFEGAAIIHWKLVEGASAGLGFGELSSLATEAIAFHETLLNRFGKTISNYAKQKVNS